MKMPWKKIGKIALIAAELTPAGSAVGKVARTIKAIHEAESVPDAAGPEKKASVLERVGAATPAVSAALSAFIDAYVAVQNARAQVKAAWVALKAAIAAAKAA